jgi:DNA (cytosine-5)-methyltransferase 1
MMRHLDLFSGIGGFALAASWVWGDEHEIVSFCDNDKAAQVVLQKHWPEVPIHDDIKTLDATKWRGTVDLVTGGFPCHPFSCAGKRRGAADDRYLWPEMLRVIAECQPHWVLGENVPGIIHMELDKVLADLDGGGYETGTVIIPACAVDASHIRSRIWIVAKSRRSSNGADEQELRAECQASSVTCEGRQDVADAGGSIGRRCSRPRWWIRECEEVEANGGRRNGEGYGVWLPEPALGRVANGVPYRVDRLRLLGNAIVPQVAEQIFRAMKAVDESKEEV